MAATRTRPSFWYDRNIGCAGAGLLVLAIVLGMYFKVCGR